jgi:hypothetical protein
MYYFSACFSFTRGLGKASLKPLRLLLLLCFNFCLFAMFLSSLDVSIYKIVRSRDNPSRSLDRLLHIPKWPIK